jgi:hypothetical protein
MPKQTSKTKGLSARSLDNYALYEAAVQTPDVERVFIDRQFRRLKGRAPLSLREDFCGTGFFACDWVRSHPARVALGLDLDPKPLAWGQRHHLAALNPAQQARVRLLRRDVLKSQGLPPPRSPSARPDGAPARGFDVVAAFNFSYYIFKQRRVLLEYFRTARAALVPDGVFTLDYVGGSECHLDGFVERNPRSAGRGKPFVFLWDHDTFEPISGRMLCHIHFEFPDGSVRRRAFTYDWRLWSLPELQDLLAEAGFSRTHVFWEGTNDRGRGDGIFRPSTRGTADRSYIGYIIAER